MPGPFHVADRYLEAAGLMGAIRARLSLDSLRRPIRGLPVTTVSMF